MRNTAKKMEPAEPLYAVPDEDKLGRQARRLVMGCGLMLVASSLSDGGILPFWAALPLLAAGLAVLAAAAGEEDA